MPYADTETYKDAEKVKKMVFRAVKKSREAYEPLREKQWPRAFLYYHSKHDLTMFRRMVQATGDGGYPYDVEVFYPTILEQIETQTPRLVRSLLANEPFLRAKPVMTTEDIAHQAELEYHAEMCGQLVQEQMIRDLRLRRHMASWVRDSKIFGIKWLWIDWVYRRGEDWKQTPVADRPGTWKYEKGETEIVLEDHIRVVGKSPWDVYPDPMGRSVHGRGCSPGCRYIAAQGPEDIDTIWAWVKAHPEKPWWFKRRNKENPSASTRAESSAYQDLKNLQGQVTGEQDKLRELQGKVGMLSKTDSTGFTSTEEDKRLIRYTDYFEPPGGNHVLVLGEDGGKSLAALIEPVPIRKLGLPAIAVRPVPLDGQLYCRGVPATVEGLVHMINATVNLRLHDLKRSVHPITVVNEDAGLTASDILMQSVPVFNVDGSVPASEAIHIHSFPPANNDSYVELNNMEDHLRKAAGGTSATMGGGQETKYQPWRSTEALLEQVGARFALESTQVAEDFAELAWAMHQTNRQMITASVLVRLHGSDAEPTMGHRDAYRQIDPDTIDREIELWFDARPEAANPLALAKAMVEWGKIAFGSPDFNQARYILDTGKAFGVPRPERYVNKPSKLPEHENHFFRQAGYMPTPPNFGDNDGYHLMVHDRLLADGTVETMDDEAKASYAGHCEQHRKNQTAKRARPPPGAGGPPERGPR